jgi:cytochrome c peroxidase
MNFHFLDRAESNVQRHPEYAEGFESLGAETSFEEIAETLAKYERTLTSGNSPFDRSYYGQQAEALGEKERRSLALFTGKARCCGCHTIGNRYPLRSSRPLDFITLGLATIPQSAHVRRAYWANESCG